MRRRAVAEALASLARDNDMVVIFGASAMCDPDDVIPAAITAAGGDVVRAGMPVDPGQSAGARQHSRGKPVLGAPGCARSPKENGFDWVLDRLIGRHSTSPHDDIAGLGRRRSARWRSRRRPQPRESVRAARIAAVDAIVLAAGRSSRMGGPNKLLALFDGRAAGAAHRRDARSPAGPPALVVVIGHQAERVTAALCGLDGQASPTTPIISSGLASSLKTGVAAIPPDAAGALVMLGDMPDSPPPTSTG